LILTIRNNFKTGEYIRLVVTAVGVDLIRLSDGDALDIIAEDFGFLKAASQSEENTGAINTVATTPLTNFTAFALRVIGADSGNFLATVIRNGLLSKEDKAKIDAGNNEINYGTFGPVDVNYASPVGTNVAVSGNITQAQVTANTSNGEVYTITLGNPMADTNYSVDISIESLGTLEADNDLKPVIWKKISNTQFEIYLEEDAGGTKSIKIHLSVKQR